jgi:hypothetical protein
MNHLSLFYLLLLALNFSGRPAEPAPAPLAATKVTLPPNGREEDEEHIPWKWERRLNWEDFRCAPRSHSDAVASTSTSLGLTYQVEDGALTYTVTCHFSKRKSWGLLKTDYILAHEQAHFDITELHARALYKALQEYQFNPRTYRQDVNTLYNRIVKEKEAMQAAYDGETDHSRNKRLQYDWLSKIDNLLSESAAWAAYP